MREAAIEERRFATAHQPNNGFQPLTIQTPNPNTASSLATDEHGLEKQLLQIHPRHPCNPRFPTPSCLRKGEEPKLRS